MISVVIPLYNKAHTIVKTLNTVMCQTYNDFEVIIVNDGSTDNGVEVIKMNFSDRRIRIINQENAGVGAARNRGAEEARGEWLAFLDGDDEWHPHYLSIVKDAIDKYPEAGMVFTGGLITDVHNPDIIYYRVAKKYVGQTRLINLFECPVLLSHTSGTTISRELFQTVGGFPRGMKCCEDFTCTQCAALLAPAAYVGLPISKYNGDVEGQITSVGPEVRIGWIQYVIKYYNTVMVAFKTYGSTNQMVKEFFRYDIRHRIKCYLAKRNYKGLDYFLSNLSSDNSALLNSAEKWLYKNKCRAIAILWINFTKCLRLMKGRVTFGQKVDITKIPATYRNW